MEKSFFILSMDKKIKTILVYVLIGIIITLLLTLIFYNILTHKEKPLVENGFIDLSEWDFDNDGTIALRGDWKFKWLEDNPVFIEPNYDDSSWDSFNVPGVWNWKTKESFGFCWLRMRLKIPTEQHLSLLIKYCSTSYALYINGKKINEVGRAGNTREKSAPNLSSAIIPLDGETGDMVIALKVSNYFDVMGGPFHSILIGKQKQIIYSAGFEIFINGLVLGVILMMAGFHFLLWLGKPDAKANLYFSIVCILLFLRQLNYLIFMLVPIEQSWIYEIRQKLEFLVLWNFIFFVFFIKTFLNEKNNQHFSRLIWILISCTAAWSVFVLLTPSWVFTLNIPVTFIIGAVIFFYIFFIIINNIKNNIDYVKHLLWGTVIVFLCLLYDIAVLYIKSLPINSGIISYSSVVFLLLQSMAISKRYSQALKTSEYLMQNLKEEVAKQTILLTDKKHELEQLNRELKEKDKYKTQFFQNVTHELRTPLTLLTGPLENILQNNNKTLTTAVKEQLEIVSRNAYQLLELINQVLDLSKIDAKRMKVHYERFNFEFFIQSVFSTFTPLAASMKMQYKLVTDDQDSFICSDKDKLTRILTNILSNAFKFTRHGGAITIETTFDAIINKQPGSDIPAFKISVSDTGIGMKEHELAYIFERYRQLDGSTTRRYSGTGIGLAIVKEYTELLGGLVSVQSKAGEGTTFTLLFPTNQKMDCLTKDYGVSPSVLTTLSTYPVRSEAESHSTATRKEQNRHECILIADDNQDMRTHILHILDEKYRIIEAVDGREAFKATLEFMPDIVLADIMMPGMDGYQLLNALHENERTTDIPVIIISAKTFNEYTTELSVAAPADFLSKPFSASELLKRISNVLSLRRQNREINRLWETKFLNIGNTNLTQEIRLQEQQTLSDAAGNSSKSIILLVEDNKELLLYLEHNLREHYRVLTAENGQRALELLEKNQEQPQLILSDIAMPEMDGWMLFKKILDQKAYQHIPFIFLTAKADDKIKGLAMGAVDYITKPFLVDELISKIDTLIRLQEALKKNNVLSMKEKILKVLSPDNEVDQPLNRFEEKCELFNITRREKEIIRLVKRGYLDKEIAYELNISKYTVNTHIKNLFKKCNSNNRAELINKIYN